MSEQINKFMKVLREFIDIVEGRGDLKSRIKLILAPENPQTASKLTIGQVSYVNDAITLSGYFEELDPLKEDAMELCRTMLSHEGYGIGKTIDLQRAFTKEVTEKITERVKEDKKEGESKVE